LNEAFSTRLFDLNPVRDISWPNYILGAAAQFAKKGLLFTGFNAVLMSDVPIGAGLSSSAAVECAAIFALNELLEVNLSRLEMVKMAQKAEHEFAGVLCGIMDQFASMMGKKDHVIKLDCRSLEYQYIPLCLEGYKIVLLNTNVKHSLASSEYNDRRRDGEQAVEWVRRHHPDVRSLRDVNRTMLKKYVANRSGVIEKRSRFVIQEIQRLHAACHDLAQQDLLSLGKRMFCTHYGLSRLYEVSCKELDFLVDKVVGNPAVIGARMMGGGFGGCTINIVKEDAVEELITTLKLAYEMEMNLPLTYYVASIENGTDQIK
jgi:galactokinase